MGSIANEDMAAYGLRSPGGISATGSSWRSRWPARASQRQSAGRSPISPIPQSRPERSEKSGTTTPAARRSPRLASEPTVDPTQIRDAEDAAGQLRRLTEEPERRLRADRGRLPVRLVELRRVVDEPLGGERDVDPETVDRDAVRADVLRHP